MKSKVDNAYPIFDKVTRANPQAVYKQMREKDPIWRAVGPNTGNIIWFFTRYDDVMSVLKDARFVKDARNNLPPEAARRYISPDEHPVFQAINRHLLNLDAPDHTRLRGIVHKAFTPRAIQRLEPRITAIADSLLEAMRDKDAGDLIADYAYPLPITVIAEMLGVRVEDRDKFREWTHNLLFGMSEEAAQLSVLEFVQYVNEMIDERQKQATEDILSGLIHAEQDGDKLDRMELLAMVFLLLVAGHETTVNLIGNGTLALLQHPEELAKLRNNPQLIDSAVEEILRYNGPVETPTWRFASEDIEMDGHIIEQGDLVLPSLLAANRDPGYFEQPHVFNIERHPNPHVAFGYGAHYCIGAPLARMEGTIGISKLIEALPNMALAVDVDALEWNNSLLLHGMVTLPLRYRA